MLATKANGNKNGAQHANVNIESFLCFGIVEMYKIKIGTEINHIA